MPRKNWITLGLVSVGAQLMTRQMRLTNPPETFLHPEEIYKDVYEYSEDLEDDLDDDTPNSEGI